MLLGPMLGPGSHEGHGQGARQVQFAALSPTTPLVALSKVRRDAVLPRILKTGENWCYVLLVLPRILKTGENITEVGHE